MTESLESIRVSVIMPAFNAEKTIAEAIKSVLCQTCRNYELIVVDDASTDSTLGIAEDCARAYPQISVLRNEKKLGVAETRNRGIAKARGEYIALLDSDDLWEPDKLERQLALAVQENAGLVYCSYDFIDESGTSIKRPFIVPTRTSFEDLLANNVIGNSTALIDARLLEENQFDSGVYHEDYALWLKLLSIPVTAVGTSKVLMHYRLSAGSRSGNKIHSAAERWKIYRKFLNLGMLRSVAAFCRYAVNGAVKYL